MWREYSTLHCEVLLKIGMVRGEEQEVEASCLGKHGVRNRECNLSCIVRYIYIHIISDIVKDLDMIKISHR